MLPTRNKYFGNTRFGIWQYPMIRPPIGLLQSESVEIQEVRWDSDLYTEHTGKNSEKLTWSPLESLCTAHEEIKLDRVTLMTISN